MKFSNLSSVMETGDHFKNGASLKSLMSRGKIKVSVVFSFILLGSQLLHSQSYTNDLPTIDVTNQYYQKEIYMQDVAKVEYIPLETNDKSWMWSYIKIFYMSEDYIIASNESDGDIFVYDGKGKRKYSFNHKGQGAEEYIRINSIAFDETAKEIFVSVWITDNPEILVYAENGAYKRTLPCPSNFWPYLYNFDDETLLAYDVYGIFEMEGYANRPYLFISKKDGRFTDSLNIYLPVRISNTARWVGEIDGKKGNIAQSISIGCNRSLGKNFLIADWSADTIYRLTPQKKLQPLIVRKPPMQSTDPKKIVSNYFATDKFMLLGVWGMDYEAMKNNQPLSQRQIMYDFRTGEVNVYRLKNGDISARHEVTLSDAITPENIGVAVYSASYLLDLDKKGELLGDLKELVKTLDEKEKTVLMKMKF